MNKLKIIKNIGKALLYVGLCYFTYLMVLISLQYVPIDFKVAFLRLKEEEIQLTYYQWAFFGHVYTSIFTLIIGITQFPSYFRKRFSSWHRWMGKIYVGLILFIASPTGLIMGYHANGDFWTQLSFVILALLWFWTTLKAYTAVVNKDYVSHRNFMLRSYALTLSAISLRLIKWIIVNTIALPPMDTYKIVAWAGWLVNIIIIEIYIFYKKR